MKNTIFQILQEMSQYLTIAELQELQSVLLKYLTDGSALKEETHTNDEYLELFLAAKQVEGLSRKTLKEYGRTAKNLFRCVNVPITDMTTDLIRMHLSNYQEEHRCSKASLDTERRNLSAFFVWLVEEEHLMKNPMNRIHKIKSPKKVKTVLSDEDIERIRDNCTNMRNLAIVDILYATGMRVSELVGLNKDDINYVERECVIFGKGEKERTAYFDAKTKIHLQEYIKSRDDENEALIVSLRKPHQRLTTGAVEKILREMGVDLGIKKLHPHKFRRSMATKAIDKGMPIEQVQKLLGHAEIGTTMEYAMVNESNVKISHQKYIS